LISGIDADSPKNIERYVQSARRLWRCPSSTQMDSDIDSHGAHYDPSQPATYGVNRNLTYPKVPGATFVKINQWKNPSQLIYAQDSPEHAIEGDNDSLSNWGSKTKPNMSQWRAGGSSYFPNAVYEYYRHNRWCNVLWLDGHVSGIRESLGKDVPERWYDGKN
jgi:prepilin-type processing-associated H-X9-DG protein